MCSRLNIMRCYNSGLAGRRLLLQGNIAERQFIKGSRNIGCVSRHEYTNKVLQNAMASVCEPNDCILVNLKTHYTYKTVNIDTLFCFKQNFSCHRKIQFVTQIYESQNNMKIYKQDLL